MDAEIILDYGYAVLCSNGEYIQSNVGLFRTKRNADRKCERCNKINYSKNKGTWKVVKVNMVIADE